MLIWYIITTSKKKQLKSPLVPFENYQFKLKGIYRIYHIYVALENILHATTLSCYLIKLQGKQYPSRSICNIAYFVSDKYAVVYL